MPVFFSYTYSFSLCVSLNQVDEGVFSLFFLLCCMCGFQESLGVQFWQGDREALSGLKQTAVAYGWDVQLGAMLQRGPRGLMGM